jgi:cytochrome c-type biogenesis protein CcmH
VTSFVLLAALLAALSLVFILPPLLRGRSSREDVDRARANLGVLKDQLAELESDHARGIVADEQYAEIKAELERRVLEDVHVETPVQRGKRASRWPAIVVAVLVPLASVGMYLQFGDPSALDPNLRAANQDPADGHMTGEQLEQMVTSLRQRLEKEPDNANGWLTLARTLYQMRKFDEAAKAYEKLVEMVSDDASVLADYADAAAMAQGRRFDGKPRELVARALKLDPTQWKALAMAGTDAFDQGNFKQAIAHWEKLRAQLPPEAPIAQNISSSIAEARQRAGMPPEIAAAAPSKDTQVAQAKPAAPSGPMPQDDVHKRAAAGGTAGGTAGAPKAAAPVAPSPAPAPAAKPSGGSTVSGTVDLSPELKAKVSPTDMVFIFARPAGGSRMPVALTSVQVKDLPAKFTLDDSQAMSPGMALSGQTEVIVGARVSKSGSPMPNSGDLEGLSSPVKVGSSGAKVTISNVRP